MSSKPRLLDGRSCMAKNLATACRVIQRLKLSGEMSLVGAAIVGVADGRLPPNFPAANSGQILHFKSRLKGAPASRER